MSRSYGFWYLVIGVLIVAPVGLRIWNRPPPRKHLLEPEMVQAGQMLFEHEWTVNDPLAPGGDGLGPVFNASSCLVCHKQGGVGGSGGLKHNVTTFIVRPRGGKSREGVVHAQSTTPRYQETINLVDSRLPNIARPQLSQLVSMPGRNDRLPLPAEVNLSQRNTPALHGDRLIDEIPDRVILAAERAERVKWGLAPARTEQFPVGRAMRLTDGRVGHFGWKAQAASLSDFVRAACANELGLGNPGQAQPRPMGIISYQPPGLDLTDQQCDQLTTFIASLPRPEERLPADVSTREQALAGKKVFTQVGCTDCHTPDLGSVNGLYSDLLLHHMGQPLEGGGSYNEPPPNIPEDPDPDGPPSPFEWRTPPLWGVADSAPYLHDGRAATLEEAIKQHGGQATAAAGRFTRLSPVQQGQLVTFLKTLRAPAP